MGASEPGRKALERFVGSHVVERHQRGRSAVGIQHLRAPALRAELGYLDAVVPAVDVLDEALGGRRQVRKHSRKRIGILVIQRGGSSEGTDEDLSTHRQRARVREIHAKFFFGAPVSTADPLAIHTFST
jgi:hypothetical protein